MDAKTRPTVVITDNSALFPPQLFALFTQAGVDVVDAEKADSDPMTVIREADALIVFWFPITEAVVAQLERCKIIQRVAIGFDNIDIAAAKARDIPVCNVPDYCIKEVADHTLALTLALLRQLPTLDHIVREGGWPFLANALAAAETLTFGTLGMGRIGKAVQKRAGAFDFRRIACDPYIPDADFEALGVERVTLDALFTEADILSLHVPLTDETRSIVSAERIAQMPPNAILINTSRGPVVETLALADALQSGRLSAAGIDVFETEPLEPDHPLRHCPTALLTPHIAWHSVQSGPKLLTMAAQEVLRGLRGEPLRSRVNP